jgi:hypothetical protein
LLDPPENPYVRDPVGWVTSSLGEFWWSGQHRMAQSVVDNRYSAFKASHDVSKSHTMSRLALWWIDVHPPGEAFVVTTAPTTPQVEAILWRYMGNAHKKGGLPGRITLDAKWYIGNELVAYGRKPADYDPAAFQQHHRQSTGDDRRDRNRHGECGTGGVDQLERRRSVHTHADNDVSPRPTAQVTP